MGSHLLHLLLVVVVTMQVGHSNGALSPQLYWKSALPNTPMPKCITAALESKNTKWVITNSKSKPRAIGIATDSSKLGTNIINLYFLEQDIKNGKTMKLDLSSTPSIKSANFLPRHQADKIPFSSKKLPEILNHFSVKPGSVEAKTIKRTLKDLEQPATKGQVDFVATSLESMIDFVNSEIEVEVEAGGVEIEIEAGSTEVEIEVEVGGTEIIEVEIPIGLYAVKSGAKKIVSEKSKALVCHKQKYPYAVHYCQGLEKTRAYMVPMEGAQGMKIKALALCHLDTSHWNPNHFAFKMLNIQPGTLPVCHFLPQDHIVWFTNN